MAISDLRFTFSYDSCVSNIVPIVSTGTHDSNGSAKIGRSAIKNSKRTFNRMVVTLSKAGFITWSQTTSCRCY